MPLSDEARRIVDEACAAYGPSDEDRARVGASLPLRLAAAAEAATAASTEASAAAARAGLFAGKGVVLGVTALVVVGGASVGYWWSRSESRAQSPSVASAVAPPVGPTTSQPESPRPTLAPTEEAAPEPPGRATRRRSTVAARTAVARETPSTSGPDVAGEIALLNEAQRALAGGQADRALELLDRHAREFPRGSLTEERAAARIIALCALGRVPAARAETDSFLRRSPESPLADRVRAACGK